jgi:hypothetical protein
MVPIPQHTRTLFITMLVLLLLVFLVENILGASHCTGPHCIYLPAINKGGTPGTTTPTNTLTATLTPTLTNTSAHPPTHSSSPTSTYTPTPTRTPTRTPTNTPSATPTPTSTNTPVPKPLFEQVLLLDGVDDYALARNESSLDLGNSDFTIETFFYVPDQNNDSIDFLLYKYLAYNLHISYSNVSEDRVNFTIYSGADIFRTPHSIGYNVSITNGWHHVAATFDYRYTDSQDRMLLYFDGVLVASATSSEWRPFSRTDGAVAIGATDTAFNPFVGRLDEVRISSVLRYTGNTYTVPNAPLINDNATLAFWRFDEQTGATVFADVSSNNNTLTGYNGAHTGNP